MHSCISPSIFSGLGHKFRSERGGRERGLIVKACEHQIYERIFVTDVSGKGSNEGSCHPTLRSPYKNEHNFHCLGPKSLLIRSCN